MDLSRFRRSRLLARLMGRRRQRLRFGVNVVIGVGGGLLVAYCTNSLLQGVVVGSCFCSKALLLVF